MSREILGERERGLENEFFYKVDQRLKERLKQQMQQEDARNRLACETGIEDEGVLEELTRLGLTPETVLALSLVPLIRVAWADRVVDRRERETILKAAEEQGMERGSPAFEVLEGWLQAGPNEGVQRAWEHYIGALRQAMDGERFEKLKEQVIGRAHQVAGAAGGVVFGIGAVSEKEQAVLDECEQAFSAGEA